MDQMTIAFPGGDRIEARYGGLAVATDQDGSAPSPFDLFLASIGTCAGIYVARFCRSRGLSTEGIGLVQRMTAADGRVARIDLELSLPASFPEKYREAVVKAAQQCKVKKHLETPPEIAIRVTAGAAS